MLRVAVIIAGLVAAAAATLPAVEISAEQALRPPTKAWVERALASADAGNWADLARAAGDAAIVAEAANRTEAMEGWLLVARWARLLGTDQRVIINRWVQALNTARLGHANMSRSYSPAPAPLSEVISATFFALLVADQNLSRSFFDLLTPYDRIPQVLIILERLHQAEPTAFGDYPQLALAIALVFDVPPPPGWPHGQVAPAVLPRQRPDPLAAFRFWTEADRRRHTLHRLDRLSAAELKFVVDAAAPFAELRWAQEQVRFDFSGLPGAYDAVAYAEQRVANEAYLWPGGDYALPTILATGGICVDQGYFASEVGKAKGVPTLLFRGAGLTGRHAWFGYLDARQEWQLDAGRHAEQRYVAGLAFDPQTWGTVNDHELTFLAERFRLLPTYQQSRAFEYLAQEYLRRGQPQDAIEAARRATGYESRNVEAWNTLSVAEQAAGVGAVEREATLRAAARALQAFPDLYLRFMRAAVVVLRERGQISRAEHEERQLARRFAADRTDLAVDQAAAMLNRSLAEDPPAVQLRVFESALRQFGIGAGMEAFDRLVRPFHEQALAEGREADAATVRAITRRLLPIEPDSQFAREMEELER